jgi:hypothetical protein
MSAEQVEYIIKEITERGFAPELWVYVVLVGVVILSGELW